MRTLFDRAAAICLALAASLVHAAEEGTIVPEPTVDVLWVGVFLLVFIGICVWFGIAIWRSERKSKASDDVKV